MFEGDTPAGLERQRKQHELWLAMQAAHDRYRAATEALEAYISAAQSGVDGADLQSDKAAADQRAAFENYVEARLQFSEFMVPRDCTGQTIVESSTTGNGRTGNRLTLMAAVVVLCPLVSSFAYLMHERRIVRDLDLTSRQISTLVNRTNADAQALAQRLDAIQSGGGRATIGPRGWPLAPVEAQTRMSGNHSQYPRTPLSKQKRQAAGMRERANGATPLRSQRQARNGAPGGSLGNSQQRMVALQKHEERRYYEFKLTPSLRFERVGPIGVSLRKVEANRRYFDVSVIGNGFKFDQKHVNLHQPVRLDLGGHSRHLELMAKRIDKNQVWGYVSESK